jgi:PST family polysaccharide transporter
MHSVVPRIQRAIKLDIVRVFSLTSVSTLVKMLAGFVSVKVVAVIIGPTGIALLGQLSNFSAIIMGIATGGITTGVTKYIAQHKDDANLIRGYIGTAVKLTLFFSILSGVFLVLGAKVLSSKILLDVKYSFVFIVFGITLIFYACNTLLFAIINGYKQFNLYVKISIISSIIGLCLSLFLVIRFGINGALINAVTSQSIVFIIAFFIAKHSNINCFSRNNILGKFDKRKAVQYFRFAMMAFVTTFTVPISQLIIRKFIIDRFSIQTAGWWDGMNRLSAMYLMIITSSFGVYYLPKLSEVLDTDIIRKEIKTAYKVIIPCLLVGLPAVYFSRFIIIRVLFSPEFYGMSDLFLWQVIGDFLKISSWLIAFLMVAKAKTKMFISTEIGFALSYITMAFLFGDMIGPQGIVLGYAVNYAAYFMFVWFFVYKKLGA